MSLAVVHQLIFTKTGVLNQGVSVLKQRVEILRKEALNHYGLKAHRFIDARTKSPRGVIQG